MKRKIKRTPIAMQKAFPSSLYDASAECIFRFPSTQECMLAVRTRTAKRFKKRKCGIEKAKTPKTPSHAIASLKSPIGDFLSLPAYF
jgi:hypothetical protein